MASTHRGKLSEVVVLVAGLCAGIWLLGHLVERILEQLGATVAEVTEQSSTAAATAVSSAVSSVLAPPIQEPIAADRVTTLPVYDEPEQFEAVDPTFDLLPDLEDPASRVTVLRPGESLIPSADGHRPLPG